MHLRLNHNTRTQMTLKKSEFITLCFRVFTQDEITNILKSVSKEHPKASHICTAFRIKDKEQANDDGEPSGTAGQPMLEVLRSHNVSDILVVVVRYFGGIQLGASGLTKAYRTCVLDALKNATLNPIVLVNQLKFEVSLSLADRVLSKIPKLAYVVDREFSDTLILTLQSEKDISDILNELTQGQIRFLEKHQCWIEKKK